MVTIVFIKDGYNIVQRGFLFVDI